MSPDLNRSQTNRLECTYLKVQNSNHFVLLKFCPSLASFELALFLYFLNNVFQGLFFYFAQFGGQVFMAEFG